MNTHPNPSPENPFDRDARLTAYALHELPARELAEVKETLAADPSAAQTVEQTKRLAGALRETCAESAEPPRTALREAVVARLDVIEAGEAKVQVAKAAETAWRRRRLLLTLAAAACLAVIAYPIWQSVRVRNVAIVKPVRSLDKSKKRAAESWVSTESASKPGDVDEFLLDGIRPDDHVLGSSTHSKAALAESPVVSELSIAPKSTSEPTLGTLGERTHGGAGIPIGAIRGSGIDGRGGANHTTFSIKGREAKNPQTDAFHGAYQPAPGAGGMPAPGPSPGPAGPMPGGDPRYAQPGYGPPGVGPGATASIALSQENLYREGQLGWSERGRPASAEQYEAPPENAFLPVDKATALSTFSIDVDTASYANVRRFLSQGQLPPPAAVRIEEMLNYFRYTYPQPSGEDPFSVNMELADCPWQPGHDLLRIGLKGKEVAAKERKAGNLVFLIDVSGSMQPENKLPLLKQALKMLVGELTENDSVTICTYAGDAGLKLAATNGTRQDEIRTAIDSLSAGGSTHGSAGIELAYQQAAKSFIKGGTNRVILATDGDLNVGVTDDGALVELIKAKAAGGVFLTVLGVGEGNLKDAKMEKLADNGNGVYAYLDTLREARKVLVEQLAGSLETIAKDVKLQIEFNPAVVRAYRLIGYENRVLATRDFHDDKKDAGEIGAGHTVTALYELIPTRAKAVAKPEVRAEGVEPLKYQKSPEVKPAAEAPALTPAAESGEWLTLKLRFKQPDAETSKLREYPLKSEGARFNRASADFQFAAAVASFGMLLRGSEHRGDATFSAVEEIAAGSIGPDASGYRAEFLDLVRKAKTLQR